MLAEAPTRAAVDVAFKTYSPLISLAFTILWLDFRLHTNLNLFYFLILL
jgi:hypothetical protein